MRHLSSLFEHARATATPRRVVVLAVVIVVAADVLFTSVWLVDRNEQGVVLRFGRVTGLRAPGIQLTLPYPFETMVRLATTEVRTMPIGFRLLATPNDARPGESWWLTGDTNIVDLRATLQYVVADPVAYLFDVADIAEDEPRDFALRRIGESALTPLIAHMPVDDVLSAGKARLQAEALARIQQLADDMGLGLEVIAVNIVSASPPDPVVAAFNDVSSARSDRDRMISEADGYAKDALPSARARANSAVQESEIYRSELRNESLARADRFDRLRSEVAAAPSVSRRRLLLETIEEALARANLVIYPSTLGRTFRLTKIR